MTEDDTVEQSPQADPAEVDFGSALRRARENAGTTLRAIADSTKLPITALKALEDNRIDQLPGGIYRRAIVRAYATEVGLDPQRVVQVFVEFFPDDVPSSVPPVVVESRSLPRMLRAALSLLGAFVPIVAGVFYFASGAAGSSAPRQIVDATPTRTAERLHTDALPADLSLAMMISVSAQTRLAVIADGREVVARALDAGEIVRLTASNEVVLMGDNAGAVHFSINGRAGRTLGDEGVPLSARISRDDYLSWLIQQ